MSLLRFRIWLIRKSYSLTHIHTTILKAVNSSLECHVRSINGVVIFKLVKVNPTFFPELDPLAHVSQLCSYSSLKEYILIINIGYHSHRQNSLLMNKLQLFIISEEYYGKD